MDPDQYILLEPVLDFSFHQFFVFDPIDAAGGHHIPRSTEAHLQQGFARLETSVAFNTIELFGDATVTIFFLPYEKFAEYQRVIAVPLENRSGKIGVESVEAYVRHRQFSIQPGHYRLTAAQCVVDEEREVIDLFFERLKAPMARSEIILADDMLEGAPFPLLETCERLR
ncbi:hypothetical protein DB346_10270 [Verrucomicrobia bacterium LW23]|nr:hypothetical protein DB346_10270 [Verrucomicrobia bacterium LW23]